LSLPSFLRKAGQGVRRLYDLEASHLLQDRSGAVGTETALAWPHAQPEITPQVIKDPRGCRVGMLAGGLLELGTSDHFALTEQGIAFFGRFYVLQAVA